jgi:site-specific recombinase XerD
MLEFFYKERRSLVDFRRGPVGPYFDEFAADLKAKGYSQDYVKKILGTCCLFNTFLIERNIKNHRRISPPLIESFLDVYLKNVWTICSRSHVPRNTARCDVMHLYNYLVKNNIVKPFVPKPVVTRYSWLLEPYLKYLEIECELTEWVITTRRNKLSIFLEGLGDKVSRRQIRRSLDPLSIEAYIKKHLEQTPYNLQNLVSTLRGFLRFCARQGYTPRDLSGVIPSIPRYRLASLPKGISESELQQILNVIPKDSAIGSRDYAIMMLMMGYGIRSKQVASLRLEDIGWSRSTIRFRAAKAGKEVLVPLLESVGEAIIRYLRYRPENPHREIFLWPRGPYCPMSAAAISRIVQVYMSRAGVKKPGRGSHTLRHAWAIRALTEGSPMKAIADVLGHRCLDTTFIYAKADLKTLRQVAMPWPEVKS